MPAASLLLPENRTAVHGEFQGTLKNNEAIVCIPLKTLYRQETPRLILNYSYLSNALHVQKFFGVFQDATGKYAVMEDLKNQEHTIALQDAFQNIGFSSATLQNKLRLCYEIANTVAYLHSVDMIVKVISDSSIYVRFGDNDILPVFSNLESARSIYPLYRIC